MTLDARDSYRDLACAGGCLSPWALGASTDGLASRRELVERSAHLVKVATGRLGAQLSPYLDESHLMGRGLIALMDAVDHGELASGHFEDVTARHILEELRRWARGTRWFRTAWASRVEPLCAAVADQHGGKDALVCAQYGRTHRPGRLWHDAIARELDLPLDRLQERFVEAGLAFGVSPDRMIPRGPLDVARRDGIAAVIGDLSPLQRTLLTLYYRERLSFPEIAELLDVPPAEVQGLYGRCAVAIRASFDGPHTGD